MLASENVAVPAFVLVTAAVVVMLLLVELPLVLEPPAAAVLAVAFVVND